jgi:hypothetical protein
MVIWHFYDHFVYLMAILWSFGIHVPFWFVAYQEKSGNPVLPIAVWSLSGDPVSVFDVAVLLLCLQHFLAKN